MNGVKSLFLTNHLLGKDFIPSPEYSIKETSLNVTIHSPPESCTFSLGDRQTVTTSGAMLDGWQVNHPWALSRVSPLSKKIKKIDRNCIFLHFIALFPTLSYIAIKGPGSPLIER